MFRPLTVRRRWQTTASNVVQKEKEGNRGEEKKKNSVRQQPPSSVQWAVDLHRSVRNKTSQRKHYTDRPLVEFDKVLRKLTEISRLLERSALLERDFEKDLRTIQVQLQTEC